MRKHHTSALPNDCFILVLTLAPSGPPRKILMKPMNSTSVTISWSPPVPHRRNGIITSYQLCYSTKKLLSNCNSNRNNSYRESEKESMTLKELLPATVYYFRIRAKTIAGAGPYTKKYRIITCSGEILYFVPYQVRLWHLCPIQFATRMSIRQQRAFNSV